MAAESLSRSAEVEDRELLTRAAGGDKAAFAEFARRFDPRLRAVSRRLVGNAADSEEFIQETLLKAWRNAARYESSKGAVSTFVFAIARNVAIDHWRRKSVRPVTEPFPVSGEPTPRGVGGVEMTDALVTGLAVRDALGQLSPSHREVIELAYFGGLSQTELAERIGVPLGTVKTRTFHALRSLRGQLDGQGALR